MNLTGASDEDWRLVLARIAEPAVLESSAREQRALLRRREVRDGEVSACGALSHLPAAGLLLAAAANARGREGWAFIGPGTAIVLAVAIGAATTTFSVVSGVLFRSLPYEDPDRLMSVRVVPVEFRTDWEGATMSQASAISKPPPIATPFTAAMTGFSRS